MKVSAKAGRYELIEEIGRGAMGVVYRANDPVIGRPVAVKTMRLANAGSGLSHDELLARFQTEARAAGRLTHPNIVVVYDAGEQDGLLYITMELIEGPSLQALIEARQTFPLPRVVRLIEQACAALDFAHQHSIIHRDIKPANLMLTPDDTLKVTDFGTAKILQFGAMQTAQIIGTPSYMSPEQVKGRAVDGRSDIFSLGVVLYELLTGQKPFPGDSVTTVIYKIVNEDPVPPQQLDPSIPPGLAAVVARALAKPVEERFRTCHEFMEALQNYANYRNASAEATMLLPWTAMPQAATQAAKTQAPHASASNVARGPHSTNNTGQTPRLALSEPTRAKRRGSIWLALLLLIVIGAAGYQVLPAVHEIWQRSQADREAAEIALRPANLIEKATSSEKTPAAAPAAVLPTDAAAEEPSPAASSAETVPIKPPAPPATVAPTEAAKPAARVASAAPEKPAAPSKPGAASAAVAAEPAKAASGTASATREKPAAPRPQEVPPPASSNPATRATDTATSVAEVPGTAVTAPAVTPPAVVAPYKPSRPPASPAAAAWQLRISAMLVESNIADQVHVVATGNTITLTGTLRLPQHRRLLARLRNVPDRVQIIDDI